MVWAAPKVDPRAADRGSIARSPNLRRLTLAERLAERVADGIASGVGVLVVLLAVAVIVAVGLVGLGWLDGLPPRESCTLTPIECETVK